MGIDCWIYKSLRKDEMYLYLPREDDFSSVDQALLERFGPAQLVMHLELHPDRQLARADIRQVMRQLAQQGYYLQMPPRLQPELYHGNED